LQAPAQLPPIHADAMRLRNLLMNLLDNAARHTQHGQIVLGIESIAARLHIWVQDTGSGMSAETLFQVRRNMMRGVGSGARASEGSQGGLGLVIAYHLAGRHGGDLQIESVEGRGTTCHVYLPFAPAAVDLRGKRVEQHGPHHLYSTLQEQASEQLVKKTQDYIADHFAKEITREEIADALGVSASYVSRIFRRHTGMALWDYVNGFRIARARELLEHSDMTITEIAFATGFNEPAYFSRMFRKVTGKPPKQFRSFN
jgi:AraC-like DNA-binding protein/anti-sigma regulatory factor (Ser/Thr protein kinase)